MALVVQVKRHPDETGSAVPVLRQYRLDPMYDSLEFVWNVIETVLVDVTEEEPRMVSFLLENGHQADVLLGTHMTISVIDERITNGRRG